MQETLKFLLDQALKYPEVRQQIAAGLNAGDIAKVLADHGIEVSPAQLEQAADFLKEKLAHEVQ